MGVSKRYTGGANALAHDSYTRFERLRSRLSGAPLDAASGLLFVHIPKCAGISLRHALKVQNPGHKLLCDFSREELDRAGKIVFCTRDPFDRLVSAYNHHKRLSSGKPLLQRVALGHPRLHGFTDFVNSIELERLEAYHFFYRSQFQYLKGIEPYREKTLHLRFEHLASDFEQHFGRSLPWMNRSEEPGVSSDFGTAGNRERVKSVYRADYELLPKLLQE